MHGFALWRAEAVNDGVGPDRDADGINDERVAFIVPNGMAHGRKLQDLRVRAIQMYVADLNILAVVKRDFSFPLENADALSIART